MSESTVGKEVRRIKSETKSFSDKKYKRLLKLGKVLLQLLGLLILLMINFGPDFDKCPIPFLGIIYLAGFNGKIKPVFEVIWSWKGHPVGQFLFEIGRIIILLAIIGGGYSKLKAKFLQRKKKKIKIEKEHLTEKYYHPWSEDWGTYRRYTPGLKWKVKESFTRNFERNDIDIITKSEKLRICRVIMQNRELTKDMLRECFENVWKISEDFEISYDSESDEITVQYQGQERTLSKGEDYITDEIRIQYL